MTPEFVAGLARCNEPDELLCETLDALISGTCAPSRILIVDNGDRPIGDAPLADLFASRCDVQISRPDHNLGCAASWNLIWRWAGDAAAIILNADLAVAPDTLEKMLAVAAPAVVLGYGFGCFRVDREIRDAVGVFDESYYPVYYEDADYRRRLRLADIHPVEWPIHPATVVRPGRERAPTGIVHGKHDPDGYQGWRGDRLSWFRGRVESNRAYYAAKWGGEPDHETYEVPFAGAPRP